MLNGNRMVKLKLKLWHWMLIVFMSIFFVRNLILPMVGDDVAYAFIWDGEHLGNLIDGVGHRERLTSFGDLVSSLHSHYMTWGGRIIGIGLTQLFSWEGKHLFDILNTLVFAALALLVFRVGTGKRLSEMNATYMFCILFSFWFLLPEPLETTLWMSGSCGYLWTAVIGLLFLLPYTEKFWHDDFWQNPPKWSIPLMGFAGLCAGCSVETSAPVIAFAVFLGMIYFWRKRQLQPWMVVGFVCLCIGMLILVMAPGQMVRETITEQYEEYPDVPVDMYMTLSMFYYTFLEIFWPVVIMWIPMLIPIIYYWCQPKGQRNGRSMLFQTVMLCGAAIVMAILLFVPMSAPRAGFFPTIAVIMASLSAVCELYPTFRQKPWAPRFFKSFAAIATLMFIVTLSVCIYVEWDVRQKWMDRIDYINAHKNQEVVVAPQIDLPPIAGKFFSLCNKNTVTWHDYLLVWGCDLEPREDSWRNLIYAQYYGWPKVIADGEDRRLQDSE